VRYSLSPKVGPASPAPFPLPRAHPPPFKLFANPFFFGGDSLFLSFNSLPPGHCNSSEALVDRTLATQTGIVFQHSIATPTIHLSAPSALTLVPPSILFVGLCWPETSAAPFFVLPPVFVWHVRPLSTESILAFCKPHLSVPVHGPFVLSLSGCISSFLHHPRGCCIEPPLFLKRRASFCFLWTEFLSSSKAPCKSSLELSYFEHTSLRLRRT